MVNSRIELNQLGFKTGTGNLKLEFVNALHGDTVATGDHRDTRLDAAKDVKSPRKSPILTMGLIPMVSLSRTSILMRLALQKTTSSLKASPHAYRFTATLPFKSSGSDSRRQKSATPRGTATVKFRTDHATYQLANDRHLPIDAITFYISKKNQVFASKQNATRLRNSYAPLCSARWQ